MFRIRGEEEADLHMMSQNTNWVKWMDALVVGCAGKSSCAGKCILSCESAIENFFLASAFCSGTLATPSLPAVLVTFV